MIMRIEMELSVPECLIFFLFVFYVFYLCYVLFASGA